MISIEFLRRWGTLKTILIGCLPLLAPPAEAHELSALVAPDASVEKIVGGCSFTEGPAYSPQGFLLFSDIPNSRIVRVDGDGKSSDFLKPSGRANGLMFDASGALYACQGGARQVVRIQVADKSTQVLASAYDGKKLNSPNDLALDAHGGLYFTDPRYGGGSEPLEQPVMGVYYIARDGTITRVIDDLDRPNGILVSPSGKHLYVAEPNHRQLYRYEISAPGKLSGKKLIFTGTEQDGGGPDGMAHDVHGNVYATYSGIVVLDPDGKLIGRIPVPERPANCAFGGPDNKTLYITARKSLYALPMKVAGMALQKAAGPAAKAGARTKPPGGGEGTRIISAGALQLRVPKAWKSEEPRSRMRLAQVKIPPAEGDEDGGELVIFHFPGGGTERANAGRWIKQFAANGRKHKIARGKSANGDYVLVDVTGTYNKPIGPPIQRRSKPVPGSKMLAVILPGKEGNYYLKLTGPAKTVARAATAFRASFGAKEDDEKETNLKDL